MIRAQASGVSEVNNKANARMKDNDTTTLACDPIHSAELVLVGSRAVLATPRPPFSHQLSPTVTELINILVESGAVRLLFFWADELGYCRKPPPFLAVVSTHDRFGLAYAPVRLDNADINAVFAKFTRLPMLVAGGQIVACEAIYAEVMCRRGDS